MLIITLLLEINNRFKYGFGNFNAAELKEEPKRKGSISN